MSTTHRKIERNEPRALIGAVAPDKLQPLRDLLGVELTDIFRIERHDGGRVFYLLFPGERSYHGYRVPEIRAAASLTRLVALWRRDQRIDERREFTSSEASYAVKLMHEAAETNEQTR